MRKTLAYILAVAMLFTSLAACGQNTATTIRLMKFEGVVGVADGDGRDIQPRENLMIYGGYGMNTSFASYAWMNLDAVKLAKMDEDSVIQIEKSSKNLEILVDRGGLFFNITEPLSEDETMSIRTSSMVVGIRGTCGWVEVDGNEMTVYIIEGVVTCSISDEDSGEEKTDSVSGGEMARMTLTPDAQAGERCQIMKEEFTQKDVPTFVWDELDEALITELRTEDTPSTQTDEPPEDPTGNSTVMDKEGNIYTLSNPILYTISPLELDGVEQRSSETFFETVKEDASIIYAVPCDTVITTPGGIRFDCILGAFIEEENGVPYCSEYSIGPGPGWNEFQLEEGWEGALFMFPCYTTNEAEPDISVDFVDNIAFFVPLNEAAGNPFVSNN